MELNKLDKKRIIFIMTGLMLAILLASLDSTIVGTAMPKIIEKLNGFSYYTWPVISYLLCITISMPLFGKLSDLYGFKKIYVIGIVIFLVGSALCGMSQNMLQLIFFRGLQGIGGAVLISNTMAIIGVLFPPADRAKYTGILGTAGALASIVGPTLGGYITDSFNWRWIFYVNVPVGMIALLIIISALPSHTETEKRKKVDYVGAAALVLALIPLLLGFTWGGNKYAWNSVQIMSMFAFSLVMLIGFLLIEKKAADPVIPLALFKSSVFNFSAIEMFLLNAILMGSTIFIPLFVQGVVGKSASKSGAIMTPMMVSLIIGSIVSGVIISKTQKYKLQSIIGFIVIALGSLLLVFLRVDSGNFVIVSDMIILGIGMGIVMPILSSAAQNAFSEEQMGVVTSGVQFFKLLGSTISSAVMGTILNTSISDGIQHLDVSKLPAGMTAVLMNPSMISNTEMLTGIKAKLPAVMLPAFQKVVEQIKHILANSIHDVFMICLVIALVGLFLIFFMKEIPLAKRSIEGE
ncbi:MFS transporter [Bacillus sp. BRMEA1]|uniref:MDR family MFS transporter n=1 Tax=Neobacillus endophyticus TaxID=2738405 RepID=UPI00156735A7|nr:MDR family MFS transporter [Neobacillus endophyticus]NRD76814.1 MFS transporter [Neobacillus endophyticus]